MLLLLLVACTATKKNKLLLLKNYGRFDFQGHRGCRGLLPENTIPGFLKALEEGVNTLEMDVVITKDKQVLVSHEPFFNHEITTKPNGQFVTEVEERSLNIYQLTYLETQLFDVGLKPHPRFAEQQKIAVHKPLLSTVIDSVLLHCKNNKTPTPVFNIEIKSNPETDDIYHPKPAEFIELVIAVLKEKHMLDNIIIQSFDKRSLTYLNQKYEALQTALLIEDFDKIPLATQLNKLDFIPTIYSPHFSLVTPLLVKQCKDLNMQLIPWTVNDVQTMKALIKLGVDGLISDYPNVYYQVLNTKK